jgi:hypothetical protein
MGKALAARSTLFTPLVIRELQAIETAVGGRSELVGLLALAPLNPDLRLILGLLGDPIHERKSLAEICATGNILPGELLKHIEGAALLRGKVLSAQLIGRGLPAVVRDVMERAAPYEAPCNQCQGTGTRVADPTPQVPNPLPEPCAVCQGMGRLTYPPDIEHQKLALEMGRLLKTGGGLNIIQNNATLTPGGGGTLGGGSLERLHALSDRILYDTPLDAEILHPEESSDGDQN